MYRCWTIILSMLFLSLFAEPLLAQRKPPPGKKPTPGKKDDDDDDKPGKGMQKLPPKPRPDEDATKVDKIERGGLVYDVYRIDIYDHTWTGKDWKRDARPSSSRKELRDPRPIGKEPKEKPDPDKDKIKRPEPGRIIIPGLIVGVGPVVVRPEEKRREVPPWFKGLPAPAVPQRQELDFRIAAVTKKPATMQPEPYTEKVFLRRDLKDDVTIDTYRITTFRFKHNGNAWVPFIAKHDFIQQPAPAEAQQADFGVLQDFMFWGEFDDARGPGEAALPQVRAEQLLGLVNVLNPMIGQPPLVSFKARYVALENRSGRTIDVTYKYATNDLQGRPDNWFPSVPQLDNGFRRRLQPGEIAVVFDAADRRVQIARMRIWAKEVNGNRKWDEYRNKDYWVVPLDERQQRQYQAPRMLLERIAVKLD